MKAMKEMKEVRATKLLLVTWLCKPVILQYCGRASGKGIKGHQGASATQNTILAGHQPQSMFSQNLHFKGHQPGRA